MAEMARSARLEVALRELSEIVDRLGTEPAREPIVKRIGALQEELRALQRQSRPALGERVNDAVQREADFSEQLILCSVDGILAFDREYRYTIWNPAMERMSGVPAAQVIGAVAFNVFPFLRETGEDRNFSDALAGKSVVARDRPYVVPETNRRGYFEGYYSPLRNKTGEILGGLAVVRDITDRLEAEHAQRESEQRFRQVFEVSCLGIILADGELRIIRANPRFCTLLGYREDEIKGVPIIELTHPDDRDVCTRLAQEILQGETSYVPFEMRYLKKDGGVIEASLTASAIRDSSGRLMFTLGMVEDVTERRRAERQARQNELELAHVLRVSTIGEMAAGLAHELNQPLSAIVAFAEACRRRLREPQFELEKIRDLLTQIVEQGERAGEIIRRLRSFMRKREPKQSNVDVNQIIIETVKLVGSDFQQAGAMLIMELAEELPITRADAIQIQQVIVNLLRNALDAAEGLEPVRRMITIGTVVAAPGTIEVYVRDAGCGISKKSAEGLFEPFYTSKPEGLGMGLAISRSIIDAHGGKIWAENNHAGGATFRFQLPVSDKRR